MVPFLRRRFVPNPFRDGTSSYELIFLRIFFALKKIGDGFLMGWIEGGGGGSRRTELTRCVPCL